MTIAQPAMMLSGIGIVLRNFILVVLFGSLLFTASLVNGPAMAQSIPGAPSGCSGNNGSIEVPRSSSVRFLTVDELQTLVGQYCDQSKGSYTASANTVSDTDCTVSVSAGGDFSMGIGGKEMAFTADRGSVASVGTTFGTTPTSKTYQVGASAQKSVLGGVEMMLAAIDIQFNRVVFAAFTRATIINGVRTEVEKGICAFHRRSYANTMIPGTINYASADNLPASLVGAHAGTTSVTIENKRYDYPCSLSVSAAGSVTFNSFTAMGGARVSATGKLQGRMFDMISYGSDGISIVALDSADPWNLNSTKGVHLQLDATLSLAKAGGSSSEILDPNASGDCTIVPPTIIDLPSLPICQGEACLAVKRGVGDMDCTVAVGNPINASSGNKFQRERDFIGVGSVDLRFERIYNSHWSAQSGSVGAHWRSNFDRSLLINGNVPVVRAYRPNGQLVVFKKINSEWRAEAEITSVLRQLNTSAVPHATWSLTADNDDIEYYDRIGRLIQISARGGQFQRLEYDSSDRLSRVIDLFGKSLDFTYGPSDRIATMRVPDGGTFFYVYDHVGNLSSVTIPDKPVAVIRRYFYENPGFPHALTGIEDENGKRFATWKYDSLGRAYHSEHAGGVQRTTLAFGLDGATTITDALNAQRTLSFKNYRGVANYAGETQPAGSGCEAAFRSALHDDDGDVRSSTNFNGIVTTYGYDKVRRLVTSKTEAFGRPEQRTTTTEWHANYRIPTRIAEPKRLTTFDYYPDGKLQARSVQGTKDETGAQGFSASPLGPVSRWAYVYNPQGQIDTVTGPRSGGIDKTIYSYDPVTGDLLSIRNAAGHLTTFGEYDANGRARLITDPTGLTTRVTYTTRGLSQIHSVSDGKRVRTTTFAYDNVGQLTQVTMPDGSSIRYDYDNAHRLTDITDSAGNTIHYVLNNMGSREKEEVRDASGTLKRRVVREFDSLNRVKGETGGAL
jgi:YD repeat-containing protein